MLKIMDIVQVVVEIETELTFSSYSENFITPLEMKRSPNLCACLAFDNFYHFVETSTGKDTLHDTVGTAYWRQREENANEVDQEYENRTVTEQVINKLVKRRRAFVSYDLDIEPYHKKEKITNHVMIPLDDERRNVVPSYLSSGKFKDTLWMFSSWTDTFL